jgi:HD-GYP domain-containing protein (c-di-GMP phosphodiesterase class II)
MAVCNATTLVSATAERLAAAERVEELRLFVSAGHQVVSAEHLDASSLGSIAEEAVAMVGGVAGAVLRPRGAALEVVARCGEWRGPVGAVVPRSSTASGRAYDTRKTIVAPAGSAESATLAMPLAIGTRAVGVLEVRVAAADLPLPADRLSRLNRFGQFVAIALEREDERRRAERAMAGYAQLNELASSLGGQTDTDGVSAIISEAVQRAFAFDFGGIVLTGWGRDRAQVFTRSPVGSADIAHVLGIVSGRDVETEPFRELVHLADKEPSPEAAEADDWALAVCELDYGDLTVGWLFVARSDGERYGAQDQALLRGIAAHAGAALGRAALFARIRDDYAKTIAALSASLEHGERAPGGSAGRVMEYAMLIGEELDLDFASIEQLRFAGLIHDVGKTGVPTDILLKPSVLTAEEMESIRRTAEMGVSIVDQIEFLKSLTPVVLHHHENWDGSGYPQGLAGEQIPLLARVLAVADAYESLTSGRLTGKKLTVGQARTTLKQQSGTLYDPRVVSALLAVFDRMTLAAGKGLLSSGAAGSRVDLPA